MILVEVARNESVHYLLYKNTEPGKQTTIVTTGNDDVRIYAFSQTTLNIVIFLHIFPYNNLNRLESFEEHNFPPYFTKSLSNARRFSHVASAI